MSKQNIVQCWTASDSINRILPGAAVPCLATSPKWGDNAEKYTDIQIYRQKDTQTEIYDNRCAPCIHDNNFNQTNLGSLQVLRQHFLGRKGVRSQIQLKKANRARKGGHLGCSSEYNFNEYKKHFNFTVNSQGREQTTSLIEKCAKSLRRTTSILCVAWNVFVQRLRSKPWTYKSKFISFFLSVIHSVSNFQGDAARRRTTSRGVVR